MPSGACALRAMTRRWYCTPGASPPIACDVSIGISRPANLRRGARIPSRDQRPRQTPRSSRRLTRRQRSFHMPRGWLLRRAAPRLKFVGLMTKTLPEPEPRATNAPASPRRRRHARVLRLRVGRRHRGRPPHPYQPPWLSPSTRGTRCHCVPERTAVQSDHAISGLSIPRALGKNDLWPGDGPDDLLNSSAHAEEEPGRRRRHGSPCTRRGCVRPWCKALRLALDRARDAPAAALDDRSVPQPVGIAEPQDDGRVRLDHTDLMSNRS